MVFSYRKGSRLTKEKERKRDKTFNGFDKENKD
jgi:hypothetical protein